MRSALQTIDLQFYMLSQEGAAHPENVSIISKVDQLTDWNPLEHFSAGSSVCRSTCFAPRTTLSSSLHQPGSQDVVRRHLKDFAATTGETCHTLPPWLSIFNPLNWLPGSLLSGNMIIFSLGIWEFWKMVGFFQMLRKKKEVSCLHLTIKVFLCCWYWMCMDVKCILICSQCILFYFYMCVPADPSDRVHGFCCSRGHLRRFVLSIY